MQQEHNGEYICEAVGYASSTRGSQVSVFLNVEKCEFFFFFIFKSFINQIINRACATHEHLLSQIKKTFLMKTINFYHNIIANLKCGVNTISSNRIESSSTESYLTLISNFSDQVHDKVSHYKIDLGSRWVSFFAKISNFLFHANHMMRNQFGTSESHFQIHLLCETKPNL